MELNLETIGMPRVGVYLPTFIILSSKISTISLLFISIILQAKVDLVGAPYPYKLPSFDLTSFMTY